MLSLYEYESLFNMDFAQFLYAHRI